MKKILFPALASAAILASCTEIVYGDKASDGDDAPLSINVGIEDGAKSRAAINSTQFADGAELGLFVTGKQANVKATNGGSVWTLASEISLATADGNVDVYAYYPYAAGVSNIEAVPVAVAASQTITGTDNQTDYMWAKTTASRYNAQANLTMKHALTEISFRFNNVSYPYTAGTKEGNITEVGLLNSSSNGVLKAGSGTLNAKTGAITISASASDLMAVTAIKLFDASNNPIAVGTETANILAYPVTSIADGDIKVAITIDGMTYTAALPAVSGGYAAGNRYVYPISVKQVTQTPTGTLGTTENPTGFGTAENPTDGNGNPLQLRPGTGSGDNNPAIYDYPYEGGYPLYDGDGNMLYPDGSKIKDDPAHPENHMHAPDDPNKPVTNYGNGQPILGGDSENPTMLNPDGTNLKTDGGQNVGDDNATGDVGKNEGGTHSEYVFYLPSGNPVTDSEGNMLYPDGTKVSDDPTNSGNHIPDGSTYSNGQPVKGGDGGMLYPNGDPVKTDTNQQVGTSGATGTVGSSQTGGNVGAGTSPEPGSGAFEPVKISIGVVSIEPWVEHVQPSVDLIIGGN